MALFGGVGSLNWFAMRDLTVQCGGWKFDLESAYNAPEIEKYHWTFPTIPMGIAVDNSA